MPGACGWGPARGASRPARPPPSATALTVGRSVPTAWCMPSPQAPASGINRLADDVLVVVHTEPTPVDEPPDRRVADPLLGPVREAGDEHVPHQRDSSEDVDHGLDRIEADRSRAVRRPCVAKRVELRLAADELD